MKDHLIKTGFLVMTVFFSLAIGCTNTNDKGQPTENEALLPTIKDPVPEVAGLTFEQQRFLKNSPSCASDSNHCAKMEAIYPLAVNGPKIVVENINDTIAYYVKQTLAVFAIEKAEIDLPLDQIAQNYLDEYQSLTAESMDFAIPWTVETDGRVLYQSERVASVELNNYSFTGGAHPNSIVVLLSFDLKTGRTLALGDMVKDLERLEAMVEKKFREERELDANTDLEEAGFFWGDAFTLPGNFALTEKGLYLYYNPYEAAAYALGPTAFTLTYEELGDLLKAF